jgi:drug/metabolite transporter (DMT)-like permease
MSLSRLQSRADLALVLIALIWGSTFIIVKEALNQVSTLLFLTLRFSIATIALLIIFRVLFRGKQTPSGHWSRARELRSGAIVGTFLFAGYCLQTAGLKYTTASKAGFITGFYIPLVPLIGAFVYRKVPRFVELLGVVFATLGMSLLTMPSFSVHIGTGDLLVLASTVAYALHILALGHYSKHVPFEKLSLYQIATGAIIGALTCWWIEPARLHLTAGVIFALALTGLLATAFAFAVQSWAQQFTTPTRTALIFSMEPVFAWVASFLIAGEVLSGRSLTGASLILAGILLVELKPIRFDRHRKPI